MTHWICVMLLQHPYACLLTVLLWGIGTGIIENAIQEADKERRAPIAYVAMAIACFLIWPVFFVLWLFEKPDPEPKQK